MARLRSRWLVRAPLCLSILSMVSQVEFAEAKKPDWVSTKPVSRDYYIGIGAAARDTPDYIQTAKSAALNDLASEISISVDSELLNQVTENDEGMEQEFKAKILTSTSANLEDYEMVGTWESKTHYWVHYRLAKSAYEAQKKRRQSAAASLAVDFLEKAATQEKQGDIPQTLMLYVKALESLRDFIAEPLRARVGGKEVILNNEITFNLQRILAQVKLKASGGKVEGKVNKSLPKPLKVSAMFQDDAGGEAPLAGMALGFGFVRGAGELVERVTTDDGGVASCRVAKVKADDKLQIVTARVDLLSWLGEGGEHGLAAAVLRTVDVPQARFILSITGVSASIASKEINLGQPLKVPVLEPVLKNALVDEGFSFTDDESQADMLIEISAQTRQGTEIYGQYVAFLDFNISVLDLATGEETFKHSEQKVKGIQLSFESAGLEAFKKGGEVMIAEMLPRMLEVIRR